MDGGVFGGHCQDGREKKRESKMKECGRFIRTELSRIDCAAAKANAEPTLKVTIDVSFDEGYTKRGQM